MWWHRTIQFPGNRTSRNAGAAQQGVSLMSKR
jgi:hypothetical protein